MSIYEEWRRMCEELEGYSPEAYWLVEDVWHRQVALLCANVDETISVLAAVFDRGDFDFLGSIVDDMMHATQSRELLAGIVAGFRRFYAEGDDIWVDGVISEAEQILDYYERSV